MIGHVYLYGEVGNEITVDSVRQQLDSKANEYAVHISSVGGDVFEGYTIYNILKNTGKNITVYVEGLCASIATLIAAAGNKIVMNRTAQFMIHNPHIDGLRGDSHELRNVADQLDKIKSLLIDVYRPKTAKSGLDNQKLWEMYDNETWLTAEEAKQFGFVDEVHEALKAVATIDISKYKNSDQMNKDEAKSLFDKIDAKIKNVFQRLRFKNEFTETLKDGSVIIVMADDENWTGKPVTYEDGSPVPPGEYELQSGKKLTVGEGSVITEISEAEPPAEDKKEEEDMEAQAKIQELESKLAEATEQKTQAEAKATKFENSLKSLQEDIEKIKKQTVGDGNPPVDSPYKKFFSEGEVVDPMGEDIMKELKARKRI